MYVKFPGGRQFGAGYIAPCDIVDRLPGWVKVRLSPAPPNDALTWVQWVRDDQLLTDEEAECET